MAKIVNDPTKLKEYLDEADQNSLKYEVGT